MGDQPLFKQTDEQEQVYAPQEVPSARAQVVADEGADVVSDDADVPAAAPVAAPGNAPSAAAAPPNIGDNAQGSAPGDPETQARYPIGDDDRAVGPR